MAGKRLVTRRDFSGEVYNCIESDLLRVNWSTMYRLDRCQDQANFFYETVCTVVNKYAPTTTVTLKNNDKPWLTADFKSCVDDRNLAFSSGDIVRYKKLRNKVNRLRCELRARFFKNKLNNLKKDNNRKLWSEIKGLCGFVNKEREVMFLVLKFLVRLLVTSLLQIT